MKKHNNHILKAESLREQSWELRTWKPVLMSLGWQNSYAAAFPVNTGSRKPAHFLLGQKRCSGDTNSISFKPEPDHIGLESLVLPEWLLWQYHITFYVMSVYFQPLYIITVDNSLQTILTQCIRSHTGNVLILQKQIFTFSSALCFSYLALYRLRVGRFLNAHHSAPGPTHGRGICALTWLLLNKAVLCLRSAASGR